MNFVDILNIAIGSLAVNKLRSFLTMLGIVIGNTSVILVVAIGQGTKQYSEQQLETFGPNQLLIFASEGNNGGLGNDKAQLLLSDVKAISEQAPAVKAVSPQISQTFRVSHKNFSVNPDILGATSDILYVRNLQLQQGSFFSEVDEQQNSRVVVLGSDISQKLFPNQNPLGKNLQIKGLSFQVIGTLKSKGSSIGTNYDNTIYIPITTMSAQFVGKQSINGIVIDLMVLSAQDKDSIRAAAFQATNILTRRYGEKNFTIFANKAIQDLSSNVLDAFSIMLAAIASISLLVGGIGIMNVMLVSINERTSEIGLRKAVGATKRDILAQFMVESIVVSSIGGAIGTGLGISGILILNLVTPLSAIIPVGMIVLSTSVSGLIGLFFGVIPAKKAASLEPIAALRSI